jgi:hypothetical protein
VFYFNSTWTIIVLFASQCSFATPFAWHHCCFVFLLFKIIVLLFLFDVLLCFFYSTSSLFYFPFIWSYCSTPLIQHATMCFLLDLLFSSSYSMSMFFLLDTGALLFYITIPLLLLDLLFYSSYSMLLFILLNVVVFCSFMYLSIIPMILLLFAPFSRRCNYCFSCFKLVFPPFTYLQMWRSCPNSSTLGQT